MTGFETVPATATFVDAGRAVVAGHRSLGLVLAAAAVGAVMAGPAINHAVLRWVGWRAVVPLLVGWVPRPTELGRPPARCGGCGREAGLARLPLLAFMVTGGRCRPPCATRRARWTGSVEAVTAGAFALSAACWGWGWALLPVLVFVTGAVAMSAVDLWVMRIPTRFAWRTGLVLGVALVVATASDPDVPTGALMGAGVGAVVLGGGFGALYVISPRMLGFGDVRLSVVAGALLGWLAWSPTHPVADPVGLVLGAAFLAALIGCGVGVALLVIRRRNEPFPFGPALALGTAGAALTVAVGG